MPAGIGYTGKLARLSGAARPSRARAMLPKMGGAFGARAVGRARNVFGGGPVRHAMLPKMVGRSSGASGFIAPSMVRGGVLPAPTRGMGSPFLPPVAGTGRMGSPVLRTGGALPAPRLAQGSSLPAPLRGSRARGLKLPPKGLRAKSFTSAMTSKKAMAGIGLGLGALALTRNTGSALDKQRGRPTGVYQY